MKTNKIIRLLTVITAAVCVAVTASAHTSHKEEWKAKMKSEKIAFLTSEIGLTPEDAQVFWPVYNQVENEKDAAMTNVIDSYRNLRKATEEGKTGKELSNLLDKYADAQKKLRDIENDAVARYKKVLSVEKVAKLFVAEEKFSRNHIRNMKGGQQSHENEKPGSRK